MFGKPFAAKTQRTQRDCLRGQRASLCPTRAPAGFTLIEVMSAIAIMVLAMALIVLPFLSASDYLGKGRARSEVQHTAHQAMEAMVRELSEAVDMYLLPGDPSVCAFVPPAKDNNGNLLFPLSPRTDGNIPPSIVAIRYWRISREDDDFTDGVQGRSNRCWYDRFLTNPKDIPADYTDSSYLARTLVVDPYDLDSEGDALRGVSRFVPFPDDIAVPTEREREDNLIAISPKEADADLPVLRFEPTPQANEALMRGSDNAYLYYSRFPLWEPGYVVQVFDSIGNLVDPPPSRRVDPYRGEVNFANYTAETGAVPADGADGSADGYSTITLSHLPISQSEAVQVGTASFTTLQRRPGNAPDDLHYSFLTATTIRVAASPWAGQTYLITYQWSDFDPVNYRVVATYSTRALLKVSLTVSKRDSKSGEPQDMHLEQMVKLKNVLR